MPGAIRRIIWLHAGSAAAGFPASRLYPGAPITYVTDPAYGAFCPDVGKLTWPEGVTITYQRGALVETLFDFALQNTANQIVTEINDAPGFDEVLKMLKKGLLVRLIRG